MASLVTPSRVLSVLLVLGAAGWIASGVFAEQHPADEDMPEADAVAEEPVELVQKVAVASAIPEEHSREFTMSCVTEADHQSVAVARGAGVIIELKVNRGSKVKAGDVIARISDEGRESAVKQANAVLEQRKAELESTKSLIEKGNAPRIQLPALEAAVASAEASLANAKAEADRSMVRAPIDGVVQDVPVQVGQAIQIGTQVAEVIDPSPMLAVGSISERSRAHVREGQDAVVRFIDNLTVNAKVSYVGLSAEQATRTYPVEARMENADAAIPDGVTCEMTVAASPIEAVSVPRSALVFSDSGELGIRIADDESRAQFMPVTIIDDGRESVWVSGIGKTVQVIVVGQDFVKDGDEVEAISVVAAAEQGS